MIFSNPYKKNQAVLHNVIYKKPLPPIVCAIQQSWGGIRWKIRITQCEAIKMLATNSVCQTNKLHKIETKNVEISLTVTVIKAETELDKLSDIFFQHVKSMMNLKE
jgi:hypothetical protein